VVTGAVCACGLRDCCAVRRQLISGGLPLHAIAKSTTLPEMHVPWLCWDEWLSLPVRIKDIPVTAQLVRR
jgi:hypothetical protein